ncbi:MAG: copper oxidase [Gammaproteobacteria bacterium]
MTKAVIAFILLPVFFTSLGYAQVDHSAHEHVMPTEQVHTGHAEQDAHEGHDMMFDRTGMVMNANSDVLPLGCEEISGDLAFTVQAGTQYAIKEAGRIFGFSQYSFNVPPCSRVSITFVNEDQVRHQWMLHGLPRYLYPQGMFHLEASGGETVQGTFIVPKDDATYLVHCDVTQHMEKGMKAQFVVGSGDGDLWSVPNISADFNREPLDNGSAYWLLFWSTLVGAGVFIGVFKKGFDKR